MWNIYFRFKYIHNTGNILFSSSIQVEIPKALYNEIMNQLCALGVVSCLCSLRIEIQLGQSRRASIKIVDEWYHLTNYIIIMTYCLFESSSLLSAAILRWHLVVNTNTGDYMDPL